MKPGWVKQAAQEMVNKLLSLAETDDKKSKRYVELARKQSKKYKVSIPNKRNICKKCSALLVPGKNLRVRKARKPKSGMIYTCLECGNKNRYGTGEKLKKQTNQKR